MDHRTYIPQVVSLAWYIAHVYGEDTKEAVMRAIRSLLNDMSLPIDARDVLLGLLNCHPYEFDSYVENFKMLAGVQHKKLVQHSVGIGTKVVEAKLNTRLKKSSPIKITVQ